MGESGGSRSDFDFDKKEIIVLLSVSRESDVFILPQKTAKNSLDPCRKGMQMKKWCMTLLAVAVFSMCMCGCGSPKTVLRWAMFGSFQDMTKCQKAVNEKLQEKGIDCEIEFVNVPSEYDGDYGEYLKPYWSALEEGGYDIVGMLETWSYLDMYQTAIDRGLLLPLDPMLEERETGKKLRGAYPENMWEAMKLGGSIYGVATPGLEFHCYLVFNQEYAKSIIWIRTRFRKTIWKIICGQPWRESGRRGMTDLYQ